VVRKTKTNSRNVGVVEGHALLAKPI
jgi:hypothetical protein